MTYGHLRADCLYTGISSRPTLGIEYGKEGLYLYLTYNSHNKVIGNLQALTRTVSKVTAACRLVKFVFSLVLQSGAGSRLHFLHSFDSGCYHYSSLEIVIFYTICEARDRTLWSCGAKPPEARVKSRKYN